MPSWLEPFARPFLLWNRRRLHRRVQARLIDYPHWIAAHDTVDTSARAALQDRLASLPSRPVVTLLLAAADAPQALVRQLLATLEGQIYAHWLLLVEPGATAGSMLFWQQRAGGDQRIRVMQASAQGVEARRCLIAAVHTDWLAWIDPAEQWREHALLLLVEAALHYAGAVLVYGDEDRVDAAGRRCDPQFKCDWNCELLLSHNYIGRPAMWQTFSLRAADPFADEPPGAWQHHLVLRATQDLAPTAIVHVPHVLCHLQIDAAARPTASVAAVQAHLARIKAPAHVEMQPGFDGLQVRFALPQPAPAVTIVIPTRNGLSLLRQCVGSILQRTRYPDYDIVIVDNGSDDPACLDWLRHITADARVSLRRDDRPFNFAALNNAAVENARGEVVALVNNDIEVISQDWLTEMVGLAMRPQIGAVGARLWYGDGTLQHAGVILGVGGGAGHAHKRLTRNQPGMMGRAQRLQSFSAVTAACLVVRRASFQAVGGMDAANFAVAFNDIDFCLRLRASGLRNVWTPFAELYHHESVTRGSDRHPEKKQRFLRELAVMQQRWAPMLACDPAYNPNLTLDNEHFALADQPRVSLLRPWFLTDGGGLEVGTPK